MYKLVITILAVLIIIAAIGCKMTTTDNGNSESELSQDMTAPVAQTPYSKINTTPEIDYMINSAKNREAQRMNKAERQGDEMNPEIIAAISEFKVQMHDRWKPAKELLPLIKAGMPAQEVEEILGVPSETIWHYSLFYSSLLTVRFDNNAKVLNASSDVSGGDKIERDSDKDATDPEVIAAISEFKTQLYNRQKAAEKLLPVIKTGMSTQEVEKILGAPTWEVWDYRLFYSTPSSLIIRFDTDGKVKEVVSHGIGEE